MITVGRIPAIELPGNFRELDSLRLLHWNTRAILMEPEEARGLLERPPEMGARKPALEG